MRCLTGNHFLVGVLAVGVVLASTACASPPTSHRTAGTAVGSTPAPTAVVEPAPAPTDALEPTPAPPAAVESKPGPPADVDPVVTVTSIVVRPEELELRDESGRLVTSLSYDSPLESMIAAVSVLTKAEPVVSPYEQGLESPAGVRYLWEGVTLTDFLPSKVDFGRPDYSLDFTASVLASGVAISTQSGYSVGDDVNAAAKELGLTVDENFRSAGSLYLLIEHGPELATPSGGNTSFPNAWGVLVNAQAGSGAIEHIGAPVNLSDWVL